MIYELWDLPSRNLVATYTSRSEALADLRAALADHGADYVADFMLGQEDTKGRSRVIAQGSHLVSLTLASVTESAPSN
jgi:hypothetical protein